MAPAPARITSSPRAQGRRPDHGEPEGEATEGADVLTFNDAGKLVTVGAFGDSAQLDRVFAR